MSESIVVVRMTRNLRYKLTYLKIFEDCLDAVPSPDIAELLKLLIQAQKEAIAPLSRYLRRLEVNTQDLELDEKLLGHASGRDNAKAQLRFIHDGLRRAVSWYKMQLTDRQMTAEPDLQELLLELGEIDAAKLWRTEAVMAMLRIPTKAKEQEWEQETTRPEPERQKEWRPRLVEEVGRPAWSGPEHAKWPRPSKYRRKDSK
jgi:hypothetical protein